MTTAAIVADIERESELQVERLLADADARAAEIVAAARASVHRVVDAACAREEPLARLEAARRVNAVRLRLLERRAELATSRSEAVFAAAAERLRRIAGGAEPDRWAAALGRLVDEAVALAGPGAALVVRARDLPLVEARVIALGATVRTADEGAPGAGVDAGLDAGVRATARDGSVEVDATLASRLERARVRLAETVAAGLGIGDDRGGA